MEFVDNWPMPETTGQTAVVVEDDDDIRGLLHIVLTQMGFSVHGVGSGEEAVEAVRAHDPALVTLDIGLPGAGGLDVLDLLRAFHAGPIVMLTARGRDADIEQALAAGADGYVVKPFRPRALREDLQRILGRPPGPHHRTADAG